MEWQAQPLCFKVLTDLTINRGNSSFVAGARVELAIYGYEPHVIPFHHPAINVQLLTGVIQNQYWRHLDPAAQMTAMAESFVSPGYPNL